MNYIHVVASADKNFVKQLGIMLTSLFENFHATDKKLFIHILISSDVSTDDIEQLTITSLRYDVKVEFLKIDDGRYDDFFVSHHISLATYFRISISELLNEDIHRAIYLDSDLIVKGNIAELWNTDLKGKIIGAIDDPLGDLRMDELQIPFMYSYFNAGVLVIDLENWRKQQITKKVLAYIKENPTKLVYWDQDALNAILYDKRMSIHPKWNVQTVMYQDNYESLFDKDEYRDAITNPAIIHYTSASKPWHITNNHPLKDEYKHYLQRSLWRNDELVSLSPTRMIMEKSNIFIFGTGTLAERFIERTGISVNGFLDNDCKKWGQLFCDKQVYSPEILHSIKQDNIGIIIVSSFYQEISKQLIQYGLKENEDFVWQL